MHSCSDICKYALQVSKAMLSFRARNDRQSDEATERDTWRLVATVKRHNDLTLSTLVPAGFQIGSGRSVPFYRKMMILYRKRNTTNQRKHGKLAFDAKCVYENNRIYFLISS